MSIASRRFIRLNTADGRSTRLAFVALFSFIALLARRSLGPRRSLRDVAFISLLALFAWRALRTLRPLSTCWPLSARDALNALCPCGPAGPCGPGSPLGPGSRPQPANANDTPISRAATRFIRCLPSGRGQRVSSTSSSHKAPLNVATVHYAWWSSAGTDNHASEHWATRCAQLDRRGPGHRPLAAHQGTLTGGISAVG